MSPVDADVALAVTVTASFRKYCFTFSAPSTAFALLKHDMFTYIVPLVGVSVHSGAGSGVGVLVSAGVLMGSLVVGSVGAVDVLSTLEITVLELLIAVETQNLHFLRLKQLKIPQNFLRLFRLLRLTQIPRLSFRLFRLLYNPKAKLPKLKKQLKILLFSSFFVLFSKF